ncbi:E3 ubiquitin/ISG15 ligase TRIM25-like isoform X2 [Lethenteron reissneri]|uniref:E3 ubiquitin/ISG15 ligase TRIM25-like isoform X2 n=1 Tax=Lethenteron reissneri TaxID=7753 RepID=UPI002AB7931D|nr:E3 ubiquitin/ISG15 ligase TRIM25-like isoform X2 [Lethenteron reissneri]
MAAVVVCDHCTDGQTPAVKTCLRCEMSFCATHLKPHLENPRLSDHVLVAPSANLEARWCLVHCRELEFFCTVDSSRVCSTCTITGEHKEHKVLTLQDEHETRKKSVDGIRGRITGKFARLRKALDKDEREALRLVAVKERELLSRIDEDIAHHTQEIGELQETADRLRNLQQKRDSLAFLQGHLEETRRREIQNESAPPPPTSLDATTICSLERVVNRFLTFAYGRSPTLDTNSAHDDLHISSDLRTATCSGVPQRRPHHLYRFEYWPQALCSESYSLGHHYWEVDVGSARWCRVGVAYGTIQRRRGGAECLLGGSDVSWCLQKRGDIFSVRHSGVETSLLVLEPPLRVGVHLDWDAGMLSFYSADSMALLHSFHQTFTQPLHPGLAVEWCGDSLRIVDLSGAS